MGPGPGPGLWGKVCVCAHARALSCYVKSRRARNTIQSAPNLQCYGGPGQAERLQLVIRHHKKIKNPSKKGSPETRGSAATTTTSASAGSSESARSSSGYFSAQSHQLSHMSSPASEGMMPPSATAETGGAAAEAGQVEPRGAGRGGGLREWASAWGLWRAQGEGQGPGAWLGLNGVRGEAAQSHGPQQHAQTWEDVTCVSTGRYVQS